MKNTNKSAKIPKFANPEEEIAYWNTVDSAQVVNWGKARPAFFPNLKPSTQSISIRLPKSLLEELKMLANKKDVPYQSLLKVYLSERVEKELHPV